MIVEIEKPKPSCRSALDYNENKVAAEVAELIAYRNLPGTGREDIYGTFDRYEKTRYPVMEMSFHASVNPSEKDSCSEDQVIDFIAALMDELGYGDQPLLVYRHHDIEREHYHIVSVRADSDGRKINNLYEKRRASAFMRREAVRFGFSMVEKGERVKDTGVFKDRVPDVRIHRFSPKGDKTESLREVFSSAVGYDFDGFQQLQCVLEGLGVDSVLRGSAEEPHIELRGMDGKGRPLTEFFSEEDLGMPLYEMCMTASISNKAGHWKRTREKDRLRGLVSAAMRYSRSQQHFVNILRNKGVSTRFHMTDKGEIFGITFTDHTSRSVFKGSEIRDVISVAMMREAVESGRWRAEDRGSARARYIDGVHHVRDVAVEVKRNETVGVLTRKEHVIGQPKGNAVRKKNRKSLEQRRQEYEDGESGAMDFSFEDDRFEDRLV